MQKCFTIFLVIVCCVVSKADETDISEFAKPPCSCILPVVLFPGGAGSAGINVNLLNNLLASGLLNGGIINAGNGDILNFLLANGLLGSNGLGGGGSWSTSGLINVLTGGGSNRGIINNSQGLLNLSNLLAGSNVNILKNVDLLNRLNILSSSQSTSIANSPTVVSG